ncbi:hypothetical protein [Mycolicibacterium tusciae]|uniref:hypothetical protein n=1 Tax=Mycolicibacterium tusciae TaxID=75922 RepID=UPI00024A47D7|nr:hypothetical protein [Mycolicibacterium tusciae]
MQDPKLRFALAIVAGRLHKANGDKRCGCGPCAHWVAVAAYRAGIPRGHLESALPPAAKPKPAHRHKPERLQVRICDSGTVKLRGQDVDPQEGLALLLRRLHDSG